MQQNNINTDWLKIPKERRSEILNQASNRAGLPVVAIEKDWWGDIGIKGIIFIRIFITYRFQGRHFIEQSLEFNRTVFGGY